MIDQNLELIQNETVVLTESGAVVQFHYENRKNHCIDYGGDVGEVSTHLHIKHRIKFWGRDNDLITYRDNMIMSSNIVGELIAAKSDLMVGLGLQAYTEVFDDQTGKKSIKYIPIPEQVDNCLRKSKFRKRFLNKAVYQYWKNANVFAEFMKAKDGSLLWIKCIDCKHVRAAEKVKGEIPGFYIAANWELPLNQKSTIGNEENPVYYLPNVSEDVDWTDPEQVKKLPDHFMMQIVDDFTVDDGYYHHPNYWGGEDWIDMANTIAPWHKANIKNGYTPRVHVKVPKDYFLNKAQYSQAITPEDQQKCISAAKSAQQKFINDLNSYLSGSDNAGRAIVTTEDFDPILKEWKGISIEKIDYAMQDEALLKLFERSNDANISAQGFHPTLAGISTQGRLSAGSEIRNLLNYFIIRALPRRRADILEVLDIMLYMNGLYDAHVKYTFEDVMIAKLDEDKTGMSNATTDVPNAQPKPDLQNDK